MEQQNTESNDEISLYDFWKVIVKRKILIIGLFIVFIVSTAIGSFLMPDIYRGEAVLYVVLKPEIITAKEVIDLIGNVDDGERSGMVPKSNLNVTDIKFKAIRDSKNKFVVTIDAKKADDIPIALSEVLNYLNNLNILKSFVKQEKDMLLGKSAELSEIVKSAPDLLATYHKQFKGGKLSTIGFNPIDLDRKVSEIRFELFALEQQLSKLKNGSINVAMPLRISNDPVCPKRLLNVVVAGIVSLLLGVFLAVFIEYIRNSKNKESKPAGNSLTD